MTRHGLLAVLIAATAAPLHAAIAISNIHVTNVTATSVTITCDTNVDAAIFTHYGETTNYDFLEHGDHSFHLQHITDLLDLKPGTVYHFMLEAWNDTDPAVQSADMTFTTLGSAVTPGDMDGDGTVAVRDLSLFLSLWNTTDPRADFDLSGRVDLADLSILLRHWTF
jgi:hypothetical protein